MSESSNGAPRLRVRVGMDVFSAYGDQFIGTVVKVLEKKHDGEIGGPGSGINPTGSETDPPNVPLRHEEGSSIHSASGEYSGTRMLGESMGPAPTGDAGNTGPVRQSAANEYATGGSEATDDTWCFAMRPGRINLGPLTKPLYVPTSAVSSISMDRIILNVQKDQIPLEWRKPQTDP